MDVNVNIICGTSLKKKMGDYYFFSLHAMLLNAYKFTILPKNRLRNGRFDEKFLS